MDKIKINCICKLAGGAVVSGSMVIPLPVEERKSADVKRDIKLLISRWFSALEDEGINPWRDEDCIAMANKYQHTRQDYQAFLRTLL